MSVSNNTAHRGEGGAKGSSKLECRIEPDRTETQSSASRLSGPMRIHQAAKQNRSLRFNNLLNHITPEQLLQAYHHLNKRSAKGVDDEDWLSYGQQLFKRLACLHKRIHTMKYQPQPVKRIWIPKPNGQQRPIGITTVEDKIVQQAMVWIYKPFMK